jgi:dihydrolipoamide dehydrogenase
VTILEGLPKILPGLDADLAKVVEKSFKKKKITIRTGVMVNGHTPNAFGGTTVSFGDDESVEVDAVVVSVGRRPFADELGLDGTGVSSAIVASSRSTSTAAPARPTCTRSAT